MTADQDDARRTAPADRLPALSVVIPTYCRPQLLARCLTALAASDYPSDRFEVIVVDDGGDVDLAPVIERFRGALDLRCLRQANAGPGAARNAGAAAARYELLAFTDDDCAPRPDWLRRIAAALSAHPGALVGGASVNALPDNPYAIASQTIIDVINLHFNRDHERAEFFPSNNMGVSRQRFATIGGFDPRFRCSEDRDLCDRWSARGWQLVLARDAVIDHARDMNLYGFCKQHFGYGRGAWRFHRTRKARGSGSLEVESSFYWECFRQPFRTQPRIRAWQLAAVLTVWQLTNTAGFFYEALRRGR